MLALHITVAVLAHFSQASAQRNFQAQAALQSQLEVLFELDASVRQLERGVLLFLATGNQSTAKRTQGLYSEIRTKLEHLSATSVGELSQSLSQMSGHLKQHQELFAALLDERRSGGRGLEKYVEPAFQRLMAFGDQGQGAGAPWKALVRDAHIAALRFGRSPDAELLASSSELLEGAARSAGVRSDPELVAALAEYQKAIKVLGSSTRQHLNLVNVAIAGETAELLRLSRETRVAQARNIHSLATNMAASQAQLAWISNLVAIATIVLGVVAGVWISRDIAPPLKSITATLSQLAAGRTAREIPYSDRRDEIGELSLAAQVFRRHADHREQLLREAQDAEDRSKKHVAELEDRNRDLDQFAYAASHDLQEPLRTVSSFCQILGQRYGERLEDDGRQFVNSAIDGAARMQRLVQALLAYARTSRGAVAAVRLDPRSVVEQALDNLAASVRESGAVVELGEFPEEVVADRELLVIVFQNLLSNAIKFRGREEPFVAVEGKIDGHVARFEVIDNGIGIPSQHRRQVFELLQRLHARSEFEGSGVGLAMCRRIVERLGGSLGFSDNPDGRGVRFWFTLPARQIDSNH